MRLRTQVLALGAGAAGAVILLMSPAVIVSKENSIKAQNRSDAIAVAQGVADFASADTTSAEETIAVVNRVNARSPAHPVTVVAGNGVTAGPQPAVCASDSVGERVDGPPQARRPEQLQPTFTALVVEGHGMQVIRIPIVTRTGAMSVCALISSGSSLRAGISHSTGLGTAALIVLAVVVGAALLIARRVANPLTAAASTAGQLSDGDLSARAPIAGPYETRSVGTALNRLADRIDELLATERETVADLSHRLRTPLMTVRLDVEALPDSPRKAELSTHLAQLERTLTAVIRAARRGGREGVTPRCDVASTVLERQAYWQPLAEDQGRETEVVVPADLVRTVRCAPGDLSAALDALLENAIAHTPETTALRVVASGLPDGWAQIDVCDRGPGLPLSAVQRGLSDRGSTGLGLDIARRCAESTGGSLVLAAEGPWSVVRLLLGPSDSIKT